MKATTRAKVEDFMIREAALLDEWQLDEWLGLLTDDVRYLVPSLDSPDSKPDEALFLISDDRKRLESRVKQLLGSSVWAENPRSRTRRLVTNIRVVDQNDSDIAVSANFAVWRFRGGKTDVYVGRYLYTLTQLSGALRIRERRVVMDLEALRPHGKLSFIL